MNFPFNIYRVFKKKERKKTIQFHWTLYAYVSNHFPFCCREIAEGLLTIRYDRLRKRYYEQVFIVINYRRCGSASDVKKLRPVD